MLDKFYLRQNNEVDIEKDKYFQKFFSLNFEEQEKWYDKTYDLLLLAFLVIDAYEINKELAEFKKNIKLRETRIGRNNI